MLFVKYGAINAPQIYDAPVDYRGPKMDEKELFVN
jgi:hypothetical protein